MRRSCNERSDSPAGRDSPDRVAAGPPPRFPWTSIWANEAERSGVIGDESGEGWPGGGDGDGGGGAADGRAATRAVGALWHLAQRPRPRRSPPSGRTRIEWFWDAPRACLGGTADRGLSDQRPPAT